MVDKDHWEWSDETGPRGNIREAVGLFDSEKDMQLAVDDLESHGFSNAAISRPVKPDAVEAAVNHKIENVAELEDDPSIPRQAHTDMDSWTEGNTITIMVPIYVAFLVAAGVAAAQGLEAWQMVLITIMMGGIGAACGGLTVYLVGKRRSERQRREKAWGGLLLWVRTGSADQEQKALDILRKHAGRDVHLHGPEHNSSATVAA